MMRTATPLTLEDIRARRNQVDSEAKKQKKKLRRQWDELIAPPPTADRLSLWLNRAESAASIYDGFRTGYKLLRRFTPLFGGKRKKR